MLTDERWAVLEPLVEACRPRARVLPVHLRRAIGAILWRHENGAKWRAVPTEPGPWWMAAQTVRRSASAPLVAARRVGAYARHGAGGRRGARHGLPRRHLDPRPPESRRGGEKGGTPAQRDAREALGRSRGGYGTEACVVADAPRRAVAFALAPGQAHELPHAIPLLAKLPDAPGWVVADRGYSSHVFREHVWSLGARPAVPTRRDEAPVARLPPIRHNRNRVERLWARLKEWRAIATRYEKTARPFLGVFNLAATLDWLKR